MARSGHSAGAPQEVEKLRQLQQQLRASNEHYADYWANQVEIQKIEAMAWSAQADGKPDEARNLLRKAADDEDAIEKLPVTPGPVIPARDLLQQGQPKQALKEFQVALTNAPKRLGTMRGMSRVSQALGIAAPQN